MYDVIKRLYEQGKMTEQLWINAISLGWITEEERQLILNN